MGWAVAVINAFNRQVTPWQQELCTGVWFDELLRALGMEPTPSCEYLHDSCRWCPFRNYMAT